MGKNFIINLNDIGFDDFYLIAISTPHSPHKLAFWLNKIFQIFLCKVKKPLSIDKDGSYFTYFENTSNELIKWYLIDNKGYTKEEKTSVTNNHYLLPEYQTIEFFLKIEKEHTHISIKKTIDEIVKIPGIFDIFEINLSKLKSKKNLYF